MAEIAVIITIASGFAGVLTAIGDIDPLAASATEFFGNNQLLGAAIMLLVGLLITIGFGDSFASVTHTAAYLYSFSHCIRFLILCISKTVL